MSLIDDKLFKLNELICQETTSYDMSTKMQFDWLQTILAQIDFYSDKKSTAKRLSLKSPPPCKVVPQSPPQERALKTTQAKSSCLSPMSNLRENRNENNASNTTPEQKNHLPPKPKLCKSPSSPTTHLMKASHHLEAPLTPSNTSTPSTPSTPHELDSESESTNIPMNGNRSATTPCFKANGIKFVDDDSILMDSSSLSESDVEEEIEDPIPFTVSGSMRELAQSASSFREKWIEMLHQKKAATNIPKKPFKFAFDDADDGMPENYQISDDSDNDEDEDDAMYERNPVEIHGKTIPIWARGDQLFKQLKRQQRIDPDSIFLGFTADCPLPDVFGTNKARWENRQDSGWWDADRITEEEVTRFKAALGLQ